MWTAPEREHFHRLIIEHKKNLQNVNRAMPNKNMGDILQYYLASYKSSRNYPQLKVVMTEERERKEREEEAEMLKGDGNDDYCALCDDGGGDLICCEFCPRVYHIDCMVKQEIISPKEAQRLLAGEDGGGGDVRVEMEIEVEGGGVELDESSQSQEGKGGVGGEGEEGGEEVDDRYCCVHCLDKKLVLAHQDMCKDAKESNGKRGEKVNFGLDDLLMRIF